MHPFICSASQPLSRTETFPAEIDLHSLIWLLLQQLSYCRVEGGGCSPDRMTWSHVKLLLVIGSFLFRHCIEGTCGKTSLKGWIKGKKSSMWLLDCRGWVGGSECLKLKVGLLD